MNKYLKRGMAVALCAGLSLTSLAGCSKKETLNVTAPLISMGSGESISLGTANVMLRMDQAEFESYYGRLYEYFYGITDVWNTDLAGNGELYSETFKTEEIHQMEELLVQKKHMADYGVEITSDEKAAITAAAKAFIGANTEEVLEKMSATQQTVEEYLTLLTIGSRVREKAIEAAEVEVSEEEAAQRTISYVYYIAETEAETEAESEAESEEQGSTEAVTEGETLTEAETAAEVETAAARAETETVTEAGTEAEETSEAGIETEKTATTGSAAQTEGTPSDPAEDGTEAPSSEVSTEAGDAEGQVLEADAKEAGTEAAVSEVSTEVQIETEEETEAETESPQMQAARAEALAKAEAFLQAAREAEDFHAAVDQAVNDDAAAHKGTSTFGADSGEDEAIVTATAGLEDGTLVDYVVVTGNRYYVIYVDDALNEEATQKKTDELRQERKEEAAEELIHSWMEEETFTVDEKLLEKLTFDFSLNVETPETDENAVTVVEETDNTAEAVTEAATEEAPATEAAKEAPATEAAEAAKEAPVTEAATEAAKEAPATEAATEAAKEAPATETVTEAAT